MQKCSPIRMFLAYVFFAIATGTMITLLFFPAPLHWEPQNNEEHEVIVTVDLKDILSDRSNLIIVDLRNKAQFRTAHIPGAVNIPAPWSVSEIETQLKRPDEIQQIVIVGLKRDYEQCVDFSRLLGKLIQKDAAVYTGGWEEWKACGLPVEAGHE